MCPQSPTRLPVSSVHTSLSRGDPVVLSKFKVMGRASAPVPGEQSWHDWEPRLSQNVGVPPALLFAPTLYRRTFSPKTKPNPAT